MNRIAKWDNIKAVLIYLVILGHLAALFTKGSLDMKRIYMFIYVFHMPCFVFISGLFSKKNIDEKRYNRIFSYLVMYLFVKIITWIPNIFISGNYTFSLFVESGVPWYVLAIFVFNMITIFFKQFDAKWVFCFTVLLGCLAGYDEMLGDTLALLRVFVFYPFFYMGYVLEVERVEKFLSQKKVKIFSIFILLLLAGIIYVKIKDIYWLRGILSGRNPYISLNEKMKYGFIIRFIYYGVVIVSGISVMAIVPEQKIPVITKIGQRSFQIYALHYVWIKIFFYVLPGEALLKSISMTHYKLLVIPLGVIILGMCSFEWIERGLKVILYPKRKTVEKNKNL